MTGEWWKVFSQRKFWILFPKVNFASLGTFGNGYWTEIMGVYYRAFLTWSSKLIFSQCYLRIIVRCYFLFILSLQQHYVFICWSIRLVSSDYLPFILKISPMVLPFVVTHPKPNISWVSTVCQRMLDAEDATVNKGEMVTLMRLTVLCSSLFIKLPCLCSFMCHVAQNLWSPLDHGCLHYHTGLSLFFILLCHTERRISL